MDDTHVNSKGPAGALETYPLIVGIVGIAIPVGLAALAASTESVIALVFAVITVFLVGAATLGFVLRLASEGDESEDAGAHAAE